ncbi:MAG: DUF308 domain-containing protein [Thermoanaerobaculia bacterium]
MVARRLTRFGVRFVIGGSLALIAPWVAVVSTTILIGMILIGAGITFMILALEAQSGGKGMGPLLLGMVGSVTGACLLIWPVMTALSLTALLATYSTLSGILMLGFALDLRPVHGWSRLVLGGSVALLLAASMWFQFPLTGASAVSTVVGLNLLTMGFCLFALQDFGASASASSSDHTDMSI